MELPVYIKGSSATADLGFSMSPPIPGMEGHNCIDTADPADLRVFNRATPICNASYNYWGTATPTSSIFMGNVGWSPYETVCPTGIGGPNFSLGQTASIGRPEWTLSPARPNPFNPTCELHFSLPSTGDPVSLEVFDLSGRSVKTLLTTTADGGNHVVQWHGRDDKGRSVSSGVYFARLQVGNESQSTKLVVLK